MRTKRMKNATIKERAKLRKIEPKNVAPSPSLRSDPSGCNN